MTRFVAVHGAWSAGWAWRRMHAELGRRQHQLFTPTWTGIGERRHLAGPTVGLSTHIDDLVNHMDAEDHSDVVLIAHSYGGMVATGAMGRIADRVRHVIYLDALLPRRGQSVFELFGDEARDRMMSAAAASGTWWAIPSNPPPPDTSAEDLDWIAPRRVPQPIATFAEGAPHGIEELTVPRAYIYCLRVGPGDPFGPFAAMTKADPDWSYREIDASHSPNITDPVGLADVLEDLCADS